MKNKNSTLKPIPYDNKMSKKEMFESVYTAILTKVNSNIGNKGFKVEDIQANESQPVEIENNLIERKTVKFEIQELKENNSAPENNPNNPINP